jgi:hypothetical protein
MFSYVSDRLPIVGDTPSNAPALGFPEYVAALAEAIRGGEPPQFTVGLYGAWGTGKSSLLRALELALNGGEGSIIPVQFDAWRYERSDHIVVPLLHHVAAAAASAGDEKLATQLRRALLSLIGSLSFRLPGIDVTLDPKAAADAFSARDITALDEAFSRPFAELQGIAGALAGRRMVVLIDDLDRCSPEKVVAVLEAINLVMDVPGLIFVLALDYDVLVKAVQTRYPHVNGHQFIEKMVQLPFRVPPLDATVPSFFAELLPQWEAIAADLPPGFTDLATYVAEAALRSNPRQIKRFINSFLVVQRVMERRLIRPNLEALAAVIGLQLGWPKSHLDLQEAVIDGDDNPIAALSDANDRSLDRYTERFFSDGKITTETLVEVLRLTAVVVSPTAPQITPIDMRYDYVAGGPDDPILRERERLLLELRTRGFDPDPDFSAIHHPPERTDFRLRLKRRGVRLEMREGDDWVVASSFSLSREVDRLLAAVDSQLKGNTV